MVAVSQMGSSVFHGGASTFLAISVLAFSNSYVFTVFFRTWMGIVVFGISNGFLLLPIILSEFGPLIDHSAEEKEKDLSKEEADDINKINQLNYASTSEKNDIELATERRTS